MGPASAARLQRQPESVGATWRSSEPGESAHAAAIRELEEETGIRVDRVALVARAEFMFEFEPTKHLAAVFSLVLTGAPELVENDELNSFEWWDPTSETWDGLCLLDAQVARFCLPNE